MLHKYRMVILLGILVLGFSVRFFAAQNCCVIWDERNNIFPPARMISFDLQKPNLPLVDKRPEGINEGTAPMAGKYVVKLGWVFLGDSLLGARLPFVFIDTAAILIVYVLVSSVLGVPTALLSAVFLALSQFCITTSRFADPSGAIMRLLFFLSLCLFLKALRSSNKRLLLLSGVLIGAGFWFKEHMLFLIPIFVIFLLVCREYRPWLKNIYLWGSFAIAFAMMLPLILLNLDPEAVRFRYIIHQAVVAPSLNTAALYIGELILLAIKPFPDFFNFVSSGIGNELAMENFVLGLLILIAVVWSARLQDRFVRLLLVAFLFNAVAFSFLRQNDIIQSFWSLGAFDWGGISFIPGVVLAALMLAAFIKRHQKLGLAFLFGLVAFMTVRAWDIAAYPLNAYFPRREYLLKTKYFIHEAMDLIRLGETEWARDMLGKLHKVSRDPQAALMLAEISYAEGACREGEEFLKEALTQVPDDPGALDLFEQGCNVGIFKPEILLKYQKR